MTQNEFIASLNALNINLTKEQLDKLNTYATFLLECNKHTNLTALNTIEDVYLKHFYDSIIITKYFDFTKVNTLLDIGTGAGFPGLVLKILYPTLDVTLLDSNNKKITFLDKLATLLNINVTLVNKRAEEYITDKREYFDVVTTRAVASLDILIELSIPYLKVNGTFLAMKGNYEEEIKYSKDTLINLSSKIDNIYTFTLPKENSNRSLIVLKKLKKNSSKYPRNYSKIKLSHENKLKKYKDIS